MLNTVDALRLFADGRMSLHDIRALLMSIGHTREQFAEAVGILIDEGATWRFNSPQTGEMHAEMYLTAAK